MIRRSMIPVLGAEIASLLAMIGVALLLHISIALILLFHASVWICFMAGFALGQATRAE
jgi:hypothetical protein